MEEKELIPPFVGTISVKSVLEAGRRDIQKLVVNSEKRSRDIGWIIGLAERNGVPVELVTKAFMDENYPKGHGSIALHAGKRNRMELEELPAQGFICLAIGIQDPYNLGSLARTLYAFGCSALLLPEYDWSQQEYLIEKASAGAWDRMNVIYAGYEEILDYLQKNDLPLICASRKDAVALSEYSFPGSFILAIGGALRGLPAIIENNSSQNVFIDYSRDFRNALDTPSAGAVFAWAIQVQKGK